MIPKINQPPQWLDKVPCTFQSVFANFIKLISAADIFLTLMQFLPSLCVSILGIYSLRAANRNAKDASWKPLPWRIMLFIYIVKILAPVGLYTAVNFKLPYYSPYKKIAVKACEVTTSLVYYPPGSGIKYMTEEFTIFRSISSKYFGKSQ